MDDKKYLAKILRRDNPILFLGAGFSFGGKSFSENYLPLGEGLKEIIIRDFLGTHEDEEAFEELKYMSLSKVCQYCQEEYSKEHLSDFLLKFFKNCIPADHHYFLSDYNWSKIYTTNIDDIVEKVFESKKIELIVQNVKRPSTIPVDNKIEYIKLHGCVNNPSGGFVFSTDEYIDSMISDKDYRFNSLSIDMTTRTFIFLGTSFDEINIEYYIKLFESSGFSSLRGKLIFITPKPTLYLKSKVKKIGAKIIPWDNKQFLEFIREDAAVDPPPPEKLINNRLKLFGFQNLKLIRREQNELETYVSKLYFGEEPIWEDIFTDTDFRNVDIEDKFEGFLDFLNEEKSGVFSIFGKALFGKTTFLYRIGNSLLQREYEVFTFHGRDFNYYQFFKFIESFPANKFALILDDASFNYIGIKRLLGFIPKSKQIIVVTTSRTNNHIRFRYSLVESNCVEYFVPPNISKRYANSIVKKLEEKGKEGELRKYSSHEEKVDFIKSENDILSALYKITYGKKFISRLAKELNPLLKSNNSVKEFLTILAVTEKLDLPFIPSELASMLFKNESIDVFEESEDFIKFTNKNGIKLRSRFFVNNILSKSSKKEILRYLKRILISISPQINVKHNNYWAEIHSSCMKEKLLRRQLNISSNDIIQFYDELRPYYYNNYNYWIQLGIANQRINEFELAQNYFRQAESLNPSSYMVQNSIGNNYLKHANHLKNEAFAESLFLEGERILKDLINNREEYMARAFSTHTYLYEKINYILRFKNNVSNSELRVMFNLLEKIVSKDPNDVMARHISNYFRSFLKKINKLKLININYYDLKKYKTMFFEEGTKVDVGKLLDEYSPE